MTRREGTSMDTIQSVLCQSCRYLGTAHETDWVCMHPTNPHVSIAQRRAGDPCADQRPPLLDECVWAWVDLGWRWWFVVWCLVTLAVLLAGQC